MAIVGFKNLCPPALFYLVISLVSLVIIAFQNYGNENIYCLGYYSCPVASIYLIFIVKLIYVVFWTWILNLICRAGAPIISWLLVLIPILLFFVLIGLLLIQV
jgi:hypothetical protein